MTEEAKARYEEDKPHYEIIRGIVKEEFKPLEKNINLFFILAVAVFGFMFITQFVVWKELTSKAGKEELTIVIKERERDYLKKFDYYQIEEDEHRVMKEIIKNPGQTEYLIGVINNNILEQLGFKYTTRGGVK